MTSCRQHNSSPTSASNINVVLTRYVFLIPKRNFKKELENKENTFIQLRRLSSDLSASDSAWITPQISGLSSRWENLRSLSRNRDDKLARSKARAQDFADRYNDNVNWLNEAETRVDAIALLLESESTPSLMEKSRRNHDELMADFGRRRDQIDKTLELGNNILSNAHNEAIGPLKQSIGALRFALKINHSL